MVYVTLHAAWMVLAVVVGTVAGYMGLLRATQRPGGRSALPGRFRMKPHVNFGTVFYVMLCAGLVFGVVLNEFILEDRSVMPPAIATAHIWLACLIAIFYGAGWLVGRRLVRDPAGPNRLLPRLHMVLNFTGCTLLGVQVALALYYVWIWPKM